MQCWMLHWPQAVSMVPIINRRRWILSAKLSRDWWLEQSFSPTTDGSGAKKRGNPVTWWKHWRHENPATLSATQPENLIEAVHVTSDKIGKQRVSPEAASIVWISTRSTSKFAPSTHFVVSCQTIDVVALCFSDRSINGERQQDQVVQLRHSTCAVLIGDGRSYALHVAPLHRPSWWRHRRLNPLRENLSKRKKKKVRSWNCPTSSIDATHACRSIHRPSCT